jgi:opacity protein-like surface antigen
MRIRKVVVWGLLLVGLAAGDARAQRVEVQPFVGVRFGGGFEASNDVLGPDALDINIASGFVWGGTFGVDVTPQVQLEFMYSRHESGFELENGDTLFDAALTQYHGNVLIHFGDPSSARPYIIFGAGATQVSPDADIDGVTKFSYTIGAGAKVPVSEHVGTRFQFRLTPTYVTEDAALFCDIFGFCYVVGVANYAYQWELTGGVTFRF